MIGHLAEQKGQFEYVKIYLGRFMGLEECFMDQCGQTGTFLDQWYN